MNSILLLMTVLHKKFNKKKPFTVNTADKNIPVLSNSEIKFFKNRLKKNGWDFNVKEDNYQTFTYEFKPTHNVKEINEDNSYFETLKRHLDKMSNRKQIIDFLYKEYKKNRNNKKLAKTVIDVAEDENYHNEAQKMYLDFKGQEKLMENNMKKTQLIQLFKQVIKEDLEKLNPKELSAAKAHFDPIVKKHGGKIIKYFKSLGQLAVEIQSFRVHYNSLIIASAMSKKDAQNIINAIKENDARFISSSEENTLKISPDTTFLYWRQQQ